MRAKDKRAGALRAAGKRSIGRRSKWSEANTPGVSDPPSNSASDADDNGTARVPGIGRNRQDGDLVSRAAEIIKGRNLDRYGIYMVDMDYVRSLPYEELLKIALDQ